MTGMFFRNPTAYFQDNITLPATIKATGVAVDCYLQITQMKPRERLTSYWHFPFCPFTIFDGHDGRLKSSW